MIHHTSGKGVSITMNLTKAVKEKYKMTKPNDIRVYSMDMFDSL